MGKLRIWVLAVFLLACQPLPQGEPVKPVASVIPSTPPSSLPSPQVSITPSPQSTPLATASPPEDKTLISENGITLKPLESIADYWGIQWLSEKNEKHKIFITDCRDAEGNNFYFFGKEVYQLSVQEKTISNLTGKRTDFPNRPLDGPANIATLNAFHHCVVFPDQSIFFLDRNQLRKIKPDRSIVSLTNLEGETYFYFRSMVYDQQNHRLIYSLEGNGIQTWDLQTEKVNYLYRQYYSDDQQVYGFVDGELGKDAKFERKALLALDPGSERLYVYDTGNRAVRVIESNRVRTIAGGKFPYSPNDGQGKEVRFVNSREFLYDATRGLLYLTDDGRIRIVRPTGEVSTLNLPGQDNSGKFEHYRYNYRNKYFLDIDQILILDKNHWIILVLIPQNEKDETGEGPTKFQLYAVTLPDDLPEIKIQPDLYPSAF